MICSFYKGERTTFFFAKKKKVPKKKLASLQLDRLSALCFEARQTHRKSLRFGAELFARRTRWWGSSVCAVLRPAIGERRDFFDAHRASAPPAAIFSPTECCAIVFPRSYKIFAVIFAKLPGG
jgi:hypothetical protein